MQCAWIRIVLPLCVISLLKCIHLWCYVSRKWLWNRNSSKQSERWKGNAYKSTFMCRSFSVCVDFANNSENNLYDICQSDFLSTAFLFLCYALALFWIALQWMSVSMFIHLCNLHKFTLFSFRHVMHAQTHRIHERIKRLDWCAFFLNVFYRIRTTLQSMALLNKTKILDFPHNFGIFFIVWISHVNRKFRKTFIFLFNSYIFPSFHYYFSRFNHFAI